MVQTWKGFFASLRMTTLPPDSVYLDLLAFEIEPGATEFSLLGPTHRHEMSGVWIEAIKSDPAAMVRYLEHVIYPYGNPGCGFATAQDLELQRLQRIKRCAEIF